MRRVIKFRAWHEGCKKWLHDGKPDGCHILGETIWALGEWCRVPIEELNDVVVEQFTGMRDKNGKDIYEGDLLIQHGHRDLEGIVFRVADICTHIPLGVVNNKGKRWDMGFALGEFARLNTWTGSNEPFYEVVGNVHDNPDMIVR